MDGVDQPCVELRWPHLGIDAPAARDSTDVYVVAASPENVDAVAVEPQTHAPWGLRRLLDGERGGLEWLQPNATLSLDSSLRFAGPRRSQRDRPVLRPGPGSIPFGGLESSDPLLTRSISPTGGPGQADGGPPPAGRLLLAFVRTGRASTCSASGTFDRPWLEPTGDRDGRRPGARWPPRSSSSPSSARPSTASTTATWRPRAQLRGVPNQPRRARRRRAPDTRSEPASALLWGTANLFSHPRYQAGAATNPDPEVFAYAAAQVKHMLEVTQRLGGENYVLWGGREGYDTLLNTDLRREGAQLGRFLTMVAEHKAKIGFSGQLLIEPKPMEPTKHQYDYDVATVHGFLLQHGLEGEYRVNIEANHATLAGHSFHHEVAYAVANGIFGSIDANRGDPQNGWDTDQFPNSVEDLALPLYEILRAGGLAPGGFNFDAKLRRQSIDRDRPVPRPHRWASTRSRGPCSCRGHDRERRRSPTCASALRRLGRARSARRSSAATYHWPMLEQRVAAGEIDPRPVSGSQELLENIVNQRIWAADRGRTADCDPRRCRAERIWPSSSA